MKIERRFTTEETGAYGALGVPHHRLGDPQSRRLGGLQPREPRGARGLEPGRLGRAGAEVLPQGRGAGGAEAGAREGRAGVPVALGRRRGEARRAAGGRALRRRDQRRARSSTGWPGAWTYWGWKGGYFSTEADARAYYDEMRYMLAAQMGAPNSPQWFNTGLHWAYGIDGPGQGHFYVDFQSGELVQVDLAPTSTRSRTPASSSRSPTTSSTTAGSWTSGPARRGSSSTARAPAPTSPRSAARTSGWPAAASRRG